MEEQLWYGKYRPLGLIYSGEDIEIFEIEHKRLGERRVLKKAVAGTAAEQTLRTEAALLSRFRHPSVPEVFDTEEDETEFAVIEELLEGETLKNLLDSGREVSLSQAVSYAETLCDILSALHKFDGGYIHCDIKPSNIMICGKKLKLIDFGAAVPKGTKGLADFSYGTEGYSAPEQAAGELRDERTDLYAVGRLSVQISNCVIPQNYNEKIRLAKFIKTAKKASEPHPEDRYKNAGELMAALMRSRERKARKSALKQKNGNSVCTVGVIGTHHGAGVTHTVLAAANYLRNVENKRVAVVELSGTEAMSCLVKYPMERGKQNSQPRPCRVAGFDVFACADSLLAGSVRNGNYDYCIYDLGCSSGRRMQELLRCDRKLIITDSVPWHRERRRTIDGILTHAEVPESWYVLYNFSKHTIPDDCRRLPVKAEWLAYSPDPFETTVQDEKVYGKLLSAS